MFCELGPVLTRSPEVNIPPKKSKKPEAYATRGTTAMMVTKNQMYFEIDLLDEMI
jgi:hypothetical protein